MKTENGRNPYFSRGMRRLIHMFPFVCFKDLVKWSLLINVIVMIILAQPTRYLFIFIPLIQSLSQIFVFYTCCYFHSIILYSPPPSKSHGKTSSINPLQLWNNLGCFCLRTKFLTHTKKPYVTHQLYIYFFQPKWPFYIFCSSSSSWP